MLKSFFKNREKIIIKLSGGILFYVRPDSLNFYCKKTFITDFNFCYYKLNKSFKVKTKTEHFSLKLFFFEGNSKNFNFIGICNN